MENKEFFIDCDGLKLHAKLEFPAEEKERYPLLIISHGLTGNMEEDHIAGAARTAVETGYAALRAELYGHGQSEGAFYDHTVLHWMLEAMHVIRYAKSLDFVSDIYLAGHSQGGLTAVLAAGMMNDCVKALIPLSPAMVIPDAARKGNLLESIFDPDHLPEKITLLPKGCDLSSDYIRAARILPVEECIQNYHGPVLLIHGTEDEAVPYSYAEELAAKYEDIRFVSIEGDDHCFTRHLDQMLDALRKFLERT